MTKHDTKAPPVCTCKTHCKVGYIDTSCPVCSVNMTECTAAEPTPEPSPTPTPEVTPAPERANSGSTIGSILVVLVVLVLLGGGVYYYVRTKRKGKVNVKGSIDLDDYDYGEEDDYVDFEPYDEKDEENE